MRQHTQSRSTSVTANMADEPVYVPVTPAGELAEIICREFVDRSVRLKPMEIHPDRITLAVIPSREP